MSVAFKIKHRIYHMLEHTRPCNNPFLGHMADQENRNAKPFGKLHKGAGCLPYLRYAAWRRRYIFAVHRLDRINHNDLRLSPAQHRVDHLEVCLAKQRQAVCKLPNSLRTDFNLLQGLLT